MGGTPPPGRLAPFTIPAYSSSKHTFWFLFHQNQLKCSRVIVRTNLEQGEFAKYFQMVAQVVFWRNTTRVPNFIQIGQELDIAATQSISALIKVSRC